MVENKEEIMSIVYKARATRLATTVSGMVVSSGLVITGIALALVTFGGSIAISALGGVVGAAAASAGIGASIVSKVLNNKRLKKAQQHINLDQQISFMINEVVRKYNQIMLPAPYHVPQSPVVSHVPQSPVVSHVPQSPVVSHAPQSPVVSHVPKSAAASSLQGVAATVRGAGAGFAIAEGTIETAAAAFRTTGQIAGIALAGASLAVTIPIDIGAIAYHSYKIHQSKNDPTGKTEKDGAVKILYNQLETLFKGMCL